MCSLVFCHHRSLPPAGADPISNATVSCFPSMSSSAHYRGEIIQGETYDTVNGKITLYPRALDITWGMDSRYWRLPEESKKRDPAELLQVCWLEVNGSIELSKLEKGKKYRVCFKVSLKPDAFGWADSPVYLMVKPGKRGPYFWKSANLGHAKGGEEFLIPMPPREKELRFEVPAGSHSSDKLLFGMYEIWKGRWKGGLVIHEVVIEPCN